MLFRRKKKETASEKYIRLLSFDRQMVQSTSTLIEQLNSEDNTELVLQNYSHLVHYRSDIAVMLWRFGEDPRPEIATAHQAYKEMKAYRNFVDSGHIISMDRIAGITDWDLAYSLFWFIGEMEEFDFCFPNIYSERYFTYSRYILHRVTDSEIPDHLGAAVESFQSVYNELVDRNFRDLLMLLGDEEPDGEVDAIVARVSDNWLKRRNLNFYQTSAPLLAGYDASNELGVDYQLASILKKRGWQFSESPHFWRWD